MPPQGNKGEDNTNPGAHGERNIDDSHLSALDFLKDPDKRDTKR